MGIHDGHRERLKKRFLEHGLEGFNEVNTLELLLFYAIPRQDTNVLAHRLLERFGTLEAVFSASVRQLTEVEGIGPNTALLISLVPQIQKRRSVIEVQDMKWIRSTADAGKYLIPQLIYEKDEKALLVCLDSHGRIITTVTLNNGVVNEVELNVRKIVETALKYRASSVILAHNHPDGIALPSYEDEIATRKIMNALNLVNITLKDHLVIAGDDYISFADSNYLSRYR